MTVDRPREEECLRLRAGEVSLHMEGNILENGSCYWSMLVYSALDASDYSSTGQSRIMVLFIPPEANSESEGGGCTAALKAPALTWDLFCLV